MCEEMEKGEGRSERRERGGEREGRGEEREKGEGRSERRERGGEIEGRGEE